MLKNLPAPGDRSRAPQAHAFLSDGHSSDPILSAVADVFRPKSDHYDVVVDLARGRGDCARSLHRLFSTYFGCHVVNV